MLTPARLRDERGVILALGILIIVVCLGFTVLVVNLLQLEGTIAKAQAVADSASTAAVMDLRVRFNGTTWVPAVDSTDAEFGWNYARHAVFAALNANTIMGISQRKFQPCLYNNAACPNGASARGLPITNTAFGAGQEPSAPFDYDWRQYDYREITLSYERGLIEPNKSFISLEQGEPSVDSNGRCTSAAYASCAGNPPVYTIANAVRVTIRIKKPTPLLAPLFGYGSSTQQTRVSLSALEP